MKPIGFLVLINLVLLYPSNVRSFDSVSDLMVVSNGTVRVGVDQNKGGAITLLTWSQYPKNVVNVADPGRLIQQSYYAGASLDRRSEGQHEAWSPWTWNPIQGGGVGSWARVTVAKLVDPKTIYTESIPKLWDMPDEEAAALMRQWTLLEPQMANVIKVKCEIRCDRQSNDRWGKAVSRHQEVPACYFTRNFGIVKSYLGQKNWRLETQPAGPPWGNTDPPRKAMACFETGKSETEAQGIAIFSPSSTTRWNFGPHGGGQSDDSTAGPCMHIAPLSRIALGPKSNYSYYYWLIVGTQDEITGHLETLWKTHSGSKGEHTATSEKK